MNSREVIDYMINLYKNDIKKSYYIYGKNRDLIVDLIVSFTKFTKQKMTYYPFNEFKGESVIVMELRETDRWFDLCMIEQFNTKKPICALSYADFLTGNCLSLDPKNREDLISWANDCHFIIENSKVDVQPIIPLRHTVFVFSTLSPKELVENSTKNELIRKTYLKKIHQTYLVVLADEEGKIEFKYN